MVAEVAGTADLHRNTVTDRVDVKLDLSRQPSVSTLKARNKPLVALARAAAPLKGDRTCMTSYASEPRI